MAYDLAKPLVIGIASRALFDLENENRIFQQEGLQSYREYQRTHETEILRPGTAFRMIEAFLGLNRGREEKLVEVIVTSRNDADTSLRIFNSIRHYGLDISRACLSGGAPIAPYLHAYKIDLFLSANPEDVSTAINEGIAAGIILTDAPTTENTHPDQIRIAFDGDAVLFSAESERIFKQSGLQAFQDNEAENADVPLQDGPFANFLRTLSRLQAEFPDRETAPIRTALVTSRGRPAHERPVKTLRSWGVRIDEAHFLGGVEKTDILKAFGADIFFDDQDMHVSPASRVVPTARVPYRDGDDPLAQ